MKNKTCLMIVVIAALSVTAWGEHHDLRDIVEQVESGKNAPAEIPQEQQDIATLKEFEKIMQSYKMAAKTGKPETVTPEQLETSVEKAISEAFKQLPKPAPAKEDNIQLLIDLVRSNLKTEYYKDTSNRQASVTAILNRVVWTFITAVVGFLVYLIFKDQKEYQAALTRAEKAADRTEKLEQRAQEVLTRIDTDVEKKLKDISTTADEETGKIRTQMQELSEQSAKQLKTSSDVERKFKVIETTANEKLQEIEAKMQKQTKDLIKEAEDQRNISELWNQASTAMDQKDYIIAAKLYEMLVEDHKEETAPVYYNWGLALYHLADLEQDGDKKRQLLKDACSKCDKATQIMPDDQVAYLNWGSALVGLAEIESDNNKKRQLLEDACSKFNKAIKITPDYQSSYYNLGTTLTQLAKLESDNDKKRQLLEDACGKYDKATQINPDMDEAYGNWGAVLNLLAEIERDDNKKQQLLEDACSKCDKATQIAPNDLIVYCNWGSALTQMANLKTGNEKESLLKGAEDKLLKAEEIKRGGGAYNLACLYALRKDKYKCREWLKVGEEAGTLVTREHAESDKDLKSVWNEEWFKAIRWKGEKTS